ncbi:MAG: hypothetical protein KatS3mg132_125 [Limisphaera sp.]|nr:MAG: hypothetical protein KatS3mg132_125 [Limisphaera sp.]
MAVAGANGKTTTKELLASVLGRLGPVTASPASFNNELGVPLTLLRIGRQDRAAVVEVGTNHPGELARLLGWVRPDHGVFTGVGREHLEFFGDLAGVAREEGTLAEVLPAGGVLVLNGDDPWAGEVACAGAGAGDPGGFRCGQRVAGLTEVRLDWSGTSFRVETSEPAWCGRYRIRLLGRHQARNAVLALALGLGAGGGARQVAAEGLASCGPAPHRMEAFRGARGAGAGRCVQCESGFDARGVGDVLCVAVRGPAGGGSRGDGRAGGGEREGRMRRWAGWRRSWVWTSCLRWGRGAGVMAAAARGAGLTRVLEFGGVEPVWGALRQFLRPGDALLLKASRRAGLERVAEFCRGDDGHRA